MSFEIDPVDSATFIRMGRRLLVLGVFFSVFRLTQGIGVVLLVAFLIHCILGSIVHCRKLLHQNANWKPQPNEKEEISY